ncbi:hypothetical protein P4O66_003674 [Electrophorus voltai]|uniref:Uncharacterized protein n=1 Tax=Electrophorus voltai TaxID=2609070 RepID=A0AAD8ZSY5_9TELE|nr:hypothetical protein P4O66_003674 [Electrophorus voltai]
MTVAQKRTFDVGSERRNTDLPRMPGKGKKKKGKKGNQRPLTACVAGSPVVLGTLLTPGADLGAKAGEAYGTLVGDLDWYNDFQYLESDSVDSNYPAERPSLILASLQGTTGREEPAEQFWGGPVYGPGSDIAECYGEQPGQEDRYSEMDSAESYDPCLDVHRGYMDYGETEECSDVCLWSERGSNHEEDAPMEVEEDPHRGLPSHSDDKSSQSKEPLAPKALPRARHPGASRLMQLASREAALLDEDTPPLKAKSPRVHAPTPKPCEGKKAAAKVPAPEPGDTAGSRPDTHAPKPGQSLLPKLARDTPRQAGRSLAQPTTGGLAGVPSPFPGHMNCVRLGPCPSPRCPACIGLWWVVWSSNVTFWRWSRGCSPVGWHTGSRVLEGGLCYAEYITTMQMVNTEDLVKAITSQSHMLGPHEQLLEVFMCFVDVLMVSYMGLEGTERFHELHHWPHSF